MIQIASAQNSLSLTRMVAESPAPYSSSTVYAGQTYTAPDGWRYGTDPSGSSYPGWISPTGKFYPGYPYSTPWGSTPAPLQPSPTAPPSTPPVITTAPASPASLPGWEGGYTPPPRAIDPDGTINIDRQATPGAPSAPSAPSAPNTNTMPAAGGQLAPAGIALPRINWWLVGAASAALVGLLWFFGGRRRRQEG